MTPIDSTTKLHELRALMSANNLAAYYVPSEDAHQSEYIAEKDARRAFISNFTGSAGFAIITLSQAALWTDGRYFLQASKQLDPNWSLMKAGLPETPSKEVWLAQSLEAGDRVGVDPALISFDSATKFSESLKRSGQDLVPIAENLIDAIWHDKSSFSPQSIDHLPVEFSGKASSAKVADVRDFLRKSSASALMVTALDEIAWLFNLRGSDIQFNPVFFAYALVSLDEVVLFIASSGSQLSVAAKKALDNDSIKVEAYESTFETLKVKVESLVEKGKVLISSTCNWKLVTALGADKIALKSPSPIEIAKSIKNEIEIEGFKQCHIRDGAAVCRYFAWLQRELFAGNSMLNEVSGADRLEEFRVQGANFRGLSFDTISGSGPNGAIIHYKPESSSAAQITLQQLYLCDSGAQYLDGTTDITRTVHFGIPSSYEKECFTRVFKGNMALERAIFPSGTSGMQLDVLARLPLWQAGLDFRHGTGHGVGHYLNVHEGPQSISFRPTSNEAKLAPGMTVTDEPGYYEDGKFGIRIENVLLVKEVQTPANFGGLKYFGFENLTMCPIQAKLLDLSLMSQDEIDYLNEYHRRVWGNVSPLLKNDHVALDWLEKECAPISKV